MKPLGPIPPGFQAIDGELAIGGKPVSHWAEQAGRTPLFVYSQTRDRAAVRRSSRSDARSIEDKLCHKSK